MSGEFSFQDQMDYISINQPVRQFLGSTVHTRDFTLSLRLYIPLIAIKVFYCADVVCIPYVNMYTYFIP